MNRRRHVFFITGTDTGVGKSRVAASLLAAAQARDLSTAALKPVASGCEEVEGELRNEDAMLLHRYCSVKLDYAQINPVALRAAVAPHLAAAMEGRQLSVQRLAGYSRALLMERADFTIVEGAGGWRVPLNQREMLSDLPRALQWPVILVVGVRLGCINHAVLTAEAIVRDGLPLVGWVANHLDETTEVAQQNVDTLRQLLPAPCLGELSWRPEDSPPQCASFLDFDVLLR